MTTIDFRAQNGKCVAGSKDSENSELNYKTIEDLITRLSSDGAALNLEGNQLQQRVEMIAREVGIQVTETLLKSIKEHILGYGILEPCLSAEGVNNVYVNRFDDIWIQKGLKRTKTDISFGSVENLRSYIRILKSQLGGEINHDKAEATFFDKKRNLRIVCVIEPVALYSPTIVIRIHRSVKNFSLAELIELETLSDDQASLLVSALKANKNIIFSGIGGSGKSTLMRSILEEAEEERRIMTIEEEAELQLKKANVVAYNLKKNERGKVIGMAKLIELGLKKGIDTYVLGENRGEEALSIIDAGTSGHQFLTTIHAKNRKDVPKRLVINMKKSGTDIDVSTLSEMITDTVDVIVQMKAFKVEEIWMKEGANEIDFDQSADTFTLGTAN